MTTNNAAFWDRSTHVESSMVRLLMSPINTYIDDSFDSMSTSVVSSCTRGSNVGRKSSPGRKCL